MFDSYVEPARDQFGFSELTTHSVFIYPRISLIAFLIVVSCHHQEPDVFIMGAMIPGNRFGFPFLS